MPALTVTICWRGDYTHLRVAASGRHQYSRGSAVADSVRDHPCLTAPVDPRRGGHALLERRHARHVRAKDQRMDVVRALVGPDRLQVAHVSEDRIFVRDAVRPEQVARPASHA